MAPYVYAVNNPNYLIDPNGQDVIPSNFKVTRWADGSITVTGSVKITIQILNVSSKVNNDIDLSDIQNTVRSKLTDYLYGQKSGNQTGPFTTKNRRLKNTNEYVNRKVTYDIKTDIDVRVVDRIDDIDDGANVLLIVDKITNTTKGDVLGVAQRGGRIALMEASDLANFSRRSEGLKTVVHELLHTLGAYDRGENDKDIMNGEPNSCWDIHSEHVMEVWQESLGPWNFIWDQINKRGDIKPDEQNSTSRNDAAKYLKEKGAVINLK
ncbi:hypothetical protein GA0116948_1364 [Chitinophaga costaii]|uniref:Uncharacterized protein n=1 Tax=Chitinophaga costaii TaxID=1335309 RepID=A0A1C4G9A5_9BACT|nr:hypothetical protein GA0116948_1364 [Chitinophaga costaii]